MIRNIIKFGEMYSNFNKIEEPTLIIDGAKITNIQKEERKLEIMDYSDRIAVPSFIDIHTHGIRGIDSSTASIKDFLEWKNILIEHGTADFVPTLVSSKMSKIEEFLESIRKVMDNNAEGAVILGGRLEGPFISKEKKGAHDPLLLMNPSDIDQDKFISSYKDVLKIIDIAPELPGALDFISKLVKEDIIVSMGHSNATYEEAARGVDKGASQVTHLFNAMREFHHREVGLIGFSLLNENINAEIITDLLHVSKQAIEIAIKMKGYEKIIMITDSIMATDMPDGEYSLGTLNVIKQGIKCTLKGSDTIAGSTLTLDRALKNMVETGHKLENVIPMVTSNPAKVLRLRDRGIIKEGYLADITILDKSLNVKGIIRSGKIIEF